MNTELLDTLQESLAKAVFGSSFKGLHASEASSISQAAHAAFKDVLAYAKANPDQFGIEVGASKPTVDAP